MKLLNKMRKGRSNQMAKNSRENTKSEGTAKSSSKNGRGRKILKRIFLALLLLFIVGTITVVSYAGYVIHKAPDIDTDNIENILSQSSTVYDADGNVIDKLFTDENRTSVSIDDMPKNLQNAFIALEDKTFWKHHGFNYIRILGAIRDAAFSSNRVSGTSTITQQLARNIFLKETMSVRSIKRKIIEAYYTHILEKKLTKKQILENYLNTIYLGNNSNGVQAAAQGYFSKNVQDLTLEECASLAMLPQAPTEYALVKFVSLSDLPKDESLILKREDTGAYIVNEASEERRNLCLKLMLDQKLISKEQYEAAVATHLKDYINPTYTQAHVFGSYFIDYSIDEIINDLMEQDKISYDEAWDRVYKGGLKIHTTMDKQAQEVIENEFSNDYNFPAALDVPSDADGDAIDKAGNVIMYHKDNYLSEDGTFTFRPDEFTKNKDGSITIMAGKRLNIYDTTVHGKTDYSIEFKSLYYRVEGQLHTISGGFVNIPQDAKKKDKDGNVIVSKEFISANPDFFISGDDGSLALPSSSYTLNAPTVQPQAAMTIVENKTGSIKAMVGGRKATGRLLYNRAVKPRQPGSSIKPLGVYAPALQQSAEEYAAGKKHQFSNLGIDKQGAKYYGDYLTTGSIIVDEPTVINGRTWPSNFGGGHSGPMNMRKALQVSNNVAAVKVLLQVGFQYSADMLEKFGISTLVKEGNANDISSAALALGGMTYGVTTLDMASAYSSFPNGGSRLDTASYTTVEDKNGNVILTHENAKSHKVMDSGVAWIMTDLLKSVVYGGTAGGASISGATVGGKTGTTDNNFDIWFCGFTPSYSAALWIGNDVNVELSQTSIWTARIWGKIMDQIAGAKGGSYSGPPSNVINVGGEYFISGTQTGLTKKGDLVKKLLICKESGLLATPSCKNTEEVEFGYGTGKEPPKYYCNIHNPDVNKYPIDPSMTLWPQEDEKEKDKEKNPQPNPPGPSENPAPPTQTP